MDAKNEILDAIQIMIDRALANTTKIYNGLCKGTKIGNVAIMVVNGVETNVLYYGDAPMINKQYRVFVPEGNMSNAFMITGSGSGGTPSGGDVNSVNGKTGAVTLTASDVGAVPIKGGTMSGALIAQSNTNYTTAQVRNIIISTEYPSGGNNGDIWIKYTE